LLGVKPSLYCNTDRSVGIWKCYPYPPPGVKRELWFVNPTFNQTEERDSPPFDTLSFRNSRT